MDAEKKPTQPVDEEHEPDVYRLLGVIEGKIDALERSARSRHNRFMEVLASIVPVIGEIASHADIAHCLDDVIKKANDGPLADLEGIASAREAIRRGPPPPDGPAADRTHAEPHDPLPTIPVTYNGEPMLIPRMLEQCEIARLLCVPYGHSLQHRSPGRASWEDTLPGVEYFVAPRTEYRSAPTLMTKIMDQLRHVSITLENMRGESTPERRESLTADRKAGVSLKTIYDSVAKTLTDRRFCEVENKALARHQEVVSQISELKFAAESGEKPRFVVYFNGREVLVEDRGDHATQVSDLRRTFDLHSGHDLLLVRHSADAHVAPAFCALLPGHALIVREGMQFVSVMATTP